MTYQRLLPRIQSTVAIRKFRSLTHQPLLPESRKVHSNTIAVATATIHATAVHGMSQRDPWWAVSFARQKAKRKNTNVNSPILAHSRHPVTTRGRRIGRTHTLFPS